MTEWYTRPVVFVTDVGRSIDFYVAKLGFRETNRYEEDGKPLVGEVTREDCVLLLDCQQPGRVGKGQMFVSVELSILQALRAEFEGRGAPIRDGWWGYDTMIVSDPDGNELFFPYPAPREG